MDAIAYDTGRTGINQPTYLPDQAAQITRGFHGRPVWSDLSLISWGRWLDGRDTNNNGRDFGILPATPGTSNNLPLNTMHTVPDVDGLANGSSVSQYYASFVAPRAINATQLGPPGGGGANVNPRAVPAPPNSQKAIIVWDETGGGNVAHSKELVNKFDIHAYLDTTPIGATGATAPSTETTVYGIGTTDPFFGTPDPEGTIFPTATTYVQNTSTGLGWLYQQRELANGTPVFSNLYLIDFGPGGDSRPGAGVWQIKQEFDMSTRSSGWYRLGIDYNPTTGEVTARLNDEVFTFTSEPNAIGGFYAGYRTSISNFSNNAAAHTPARFVQFEAPPGLAGDYNGNGVVDAADYVVWRNGGPLLNETVTLGMVTPEDYTAWRTNFGRTAAGQVAAVPEPAGLLLAALGMLAMAAIRRRQ